ncbi:DUF6783 domain-containing protein [Enterocloster lavalensis]|uniref:DUF6783 domain-containing protein n=1 Tax=Enterocloster lavalensis TaxID=460384 RepID=UPI0027DF4142|nr:DUF6783 domain-containing protein [Enterocloster lavalensis]
MCVTLCGRFGPDEGGVAGYVDQIGTKYAAKWGVHMVGMNFQTDPRAIIPRVYPPGAAPGRLILKFPTPVSASGQALCPFPGSKKCPFIKSSAATVR